MSAGGFNAERRDLEEERTQNWLRRYLEPLDGAIIVKAEPFRVGTELFTGLKVRLKDGETRWLRVNCDGEGSGPGWLAGLDPVDPTGPRPKGLPEPPL